MAVDLESPIVDTSVGTSDTPASQPQSTGNESESGDFRTMIDSFKTDLGLTPKEPEVPPVPPVEPETPKAEEPEVPEQEAKVETPKAEEDEYENPDGEKLKPEKARDIKDWGKRWQETARKYETNSKFIEEKFEGDLEQAEIAADVYSSLFLVPVEEINPETLLENISEQRPVVAEKIISYFAQNEAILEKAEESVISKMFGEGKTSAEIKEDLDSFRFWQENGGLTNLLTENEEMPEELQYDAEGNRKSDAEIELLTNILKGQKQQIALREKDIQTRQQQEKAQKESVVTQQVDSLTLSIFEPIDEMLKEFELIPAKDDSPEVVKEKDTSARMLGYFVMGEFFKGETSSKLYQDTVKAVREGDKVTQRRNSAKMSRIVSELLESASDFTGNRNAKAKGLVKGKVQKATEQRKEVDGLGGNNTLQDPSLQRKENESTDESIERLKKSGLLSKDKFR